MRIFHVPAGMDWIADVNPACVSDTSCVYAATQLLSPETQQFTHELLEALSTA